MKAVVLPRRGRQHPVHRFLIYLPAKARAAQDGKIAVSEDHERPGFHACAGRIAISRRTSLQQGFLDQIIRQIGPSRQAASKDATVRNDRKHVLFRSDTNPSKLQSLLRTTLSLICSKT